MEIILNHSSMQPIYEQIVQQIKDGVVNGEMEEGTPLPSVRGMAKELKISALTVKKAYDALEEDGFVITIHGKGSYIASAGLQLQEEEKRKKIEAMLENAVLAGRSYGLSKEEILQIVELLLEGE